MNVQPHDARNSMDLKINVSNVKENGLNNYKVINKLYQIDRKMDGEC